jgi:serine protease Do
MSEFDNNHQNQDNNPSNMYHTNYTNNNSNSQPNNNQNPYNRTPEYSFWAEQMPNSNNNQNSQGNYGNPYQNNQYYGTQNYGGPNQQYSNRSNSTYGNYTQGTGTFGYGGSNVYQPVSDLKKKKKSSAGGRVMKLIGKALSFGVIAALAFIGVQQLFRVINPDSPAFLSGITDNAASETSYQIGYTSQGVVTTKSRSEISGIVEKTMPSIVSINCTATDTFSWFGQEYSEDVEGSGSGFIVKKTEKELLIATNNHVVEGAKKIKVTFIDGEQADAVIKGTDATADLAVISIDLSTMKKSTLDKISIAKLGNSDQVKVGEVAIAIGNALGYGQSVTVGYISAKDREVQVSDSYNGTKTMVLLQTDAAINPGNSGGALLNASGEVIGINTVKYASTEVEGIGYAIPITRATTIINELMTREILAEKDQGYLGIAGTDVTEDVAKFYNMPIGVFISEVTEGGAAEEAGLLANDIITKVDSIEITAISQLRDYVTSKRVGTEVMVTYMRKTSGEYQEGTIKVKLGKNPNLKSSDE